MSRSNPNLLYRVYSYRLYPSRAQRKTLVHQLDICRRLYNELLSLNVEVYKKHKYNISRECTLLKYLKFENPELLTINSQVLQDVCERLQGAFALFFRRLKKGGNAGFPRYHGVGHRHSSMKFTNQSAKLLPDNRLQLARVGSIKIKLHRDVPKDSRLMSATVTLSPNGKWHAVLSYELAAIQPLPKTNKTIGIDLGLSNYITTSDGTVIDKPNFMGQSVVKIKRVKRKLKKLCKPGAKRSALDRRLGGLMEKVNNQRRDFLHKLSRKLINENDTVCVENLNVEEMLQSNQERMTHKQSYALSCTITDAAWTKFTNMLTYKAEEAGRKVMLVDPRNTTQVCSGCGVIVRKKIKQETHKCKKCGLVLSRDHNAAINILRLGTQSLGPNCLDAAI